LCKVGLKEGMTSSGYCQPHLAPVRAAFDRLFADGQEVGAAVAVSIDGAPALHLWGGWRDKGRSVAWTADTLVPVYSTGKGVAAMGIASLVSDGTIRYDMPVGDLWPQFFAPQLTVAEVMSHQAGVPGLRGPFDPAQWYDWEAMIAAIESETPFWMPGADQGYHPVTFGFLAGKIARAATGRALGQIVHDRLCAPLNLDLWFGVPESEAVRSADMIRPTAAPDLGAITPERRAAFLEKWSSPAGRGGDVWRASDLPAVNMHTTADSLAHVFSGLACGGVVDGQTILSTEALAGLTMERTRKPDRVLPYTLSWGAGVLRNTLGFYGPNPDAVGHSGWGGSCVFADPAQRLSFAYVMNKQSNKLLGDDRPRALIAALYDCL
jgi:CubicO group peptidase (beta-lactamase class C family)